MGHKHRALALTWIHPISRVAMCRDVPLGNLETDPKELEIALQRLGYHSNGDSTPITFWMPRKTNKGNKARRLSTNPLGDNLRYYDVSLPSSMQNALSKMLELCGQYKTVSKSYAAFSTQATHCKWMDYVSQNLNTALKIVADLESSPHRAIAICDSSETADRVAQLSSTVQLILDPYYRTFHGFATLVEKEWCNFPHPFDHRRGPAGSSFVNDQEPAAPVFLLWLDAVRNILDQFPQQFEFQSNLLVFLAESVYSQQFGDFLYNCEQQRIQHAVFQSCTSVWAFIEQNFHEFANAQYLGPKSVKLNTEKAFVRTIKMPDDFELVQDKHLDWTDSFEGSIPELEQAISNGSKQIPSSADGVYIRSGRKTGKGSSIYYIQQNPRESVASVAHNVKKLAVNPSLMSITLWKDLFLRTRTPTRLGAKAIIAS